MAADRHQTGARIETLLQTLQSELEDGLSFVIEPTLSELLSLDDVSDESLSVVLQMIEQFEHREQIDERFSHVLAEAKETVLKKLEQFTENPLSSELSNDSKLIVTDVNDDSGWQPVADFAGSPFAVLPARMQQELRLRMTVRQFADGTVIFEEGTPGDCLYLVTQGRVGIWGRTLEEKLGTVVSGEVLGEMALMGIPQRTADAIAEGDVATLHLASDDFFELCERFPPIAHAMTQIIAERLGRAHYDAFAAKSLNGYTIQHRLGRGGMAIVYDAIDIQRQRRVALKMMSHRLVFDKTASAWFRQEAATISRFDHPHIPKLIECFDGFGTTFIALEFIEGETLEEILKRNGPLSEENALRVLHQLSDALSYAHQNGIVHRDVKPANVMLTPSGDISLMDFGLAIPWETPAERGPVAGTLSYMAPEQFNGAAPHPAADWFSLGCIAFELVTRRRLLKPALVSDLHDIFDRWNPDEIAGRIPSAYPRVREFTRRCLQFDPASRMQAAGLVSDYSGPVSL